MRATAHRSVASLKDEFKIGIESVDRERQRLFATIEALCDTFDSAPTAIKISGDFEALYAQAVAHFAAEEQFLRAENYAELRTHRSEHKRLLRQVRRLARAYQDGRCAECGTSLRACLEIWLTDHIRRTEPAFKALIN